jgi:hypothetical protein
MLAEERIHFCDEIIVGPDGSYFSYREAITAPDWLQRKQRILADEQRHQEAMARLERLEAKADMGLAELRLAGIVDRYVQRLEALAERR